LYAYTHILVFSFSLSALTLSCLYAFSMHALGYITPFWWFMCPNLSQECWRGGQQLFSVYDLYRTCGCVCDMIALFIQPHLQHWITITLDFFFFICLTSAWWLLFQHLRYGIVLDITLFMKINDCYHLCFTVTCTPHQNKLPHNWLTNWYTSFYFIFFFLIFLILLPTNHRCKKHTHSPFQLFSFIVFAHASLS